MSYLQVLLINPKPPILFSQISHFHFQFHPHKYFTSRSLSLPLSRKKFQSLCTLRQDNVNPGSGSPSSSSTDARNSVPESSESGAKDDVGYGKLPFFVFLMGLFVRIRNGFEKMLLSERFSWLPFWRKEKRLEMLVSEADANPNDPIKQTALLVELNKHSPESVIKRFDQREYAVDSKGVVEYIRALISTNAIAEYLPDEQTGKPSTLSALLQELKERASGNLDESFLNPGISERQPLHVIMVDQKASNQSSHFAQELISTILFTVAVGLMWVLGAAALQRYIGGLGGIGSPGVGSSSSYSSKDLNLEIAPEKNIKTFKDVKGCDDAKQELEEVVEYLKNPEKFTRLGGKLPKGILLTGAPGTGKTLLAKAIAGEAGVPFFYRAGSEFEEMFVGVGARRVRSLFQAAKKKAPCIIFIDEIDAVGSTRKQFEGHTKKTLHQLLVEMDGFEQNEGIILMAATNLPDILDPALTRPGRFDREYAVDSKGVVEYIRALISTNAIAEYLPDEQTGKPSTLSALLQELKERASGNLDESFLNPGISERQPLHVIMFSLGLDGKKIESESNVLLASIENMQYAVTLDVLQMVFSAFGPVLKIAMFDKNGGVQALIQYPDVQTAVVAKEALEGHCIYDGGFCKLHISYSRHTDLSIKVNNDRSRDYTMPAPPMMNTQPSILGQQPPQAAPQYGATQYMPGPEGYAAAPQSSAGWAPGAPAGPQSMPMQMQQQQMQHHPYMPQQGMPSEMGPGPTQYNGQNGYPPQSGAPPRYHQ